MALKPYTRIVAIGTAQSYCYESPKPAEFREAGLNWEAIGWRIRVNFTRLLHQVRPKDHMQVLGDLLPDRYSPLQPNGNGVQSIYLTELPELFAEALIGLIGSEASIRFSEALCATGDTIICRVVFTVTLIRPRSSRLTCVRCRSQASAKLSCENPWAVRISRIRAPKRF